MAVTDDPLYLEISDAVEGLRKRIFERIEKGKQTKRACRIRNVIESKMAAELKRNKELTAKLEEESSKCNNLDRLCAEFSAGATIRDSDRQRLATAKEIYELGKKLTGVRFDLSAPSTVVKGYVKSESHKTLSPFEVGCKESGDLLWARIEEAGAINKENRVNN